LSTSWINKIKDYLKGFFLYGLIDGVYREKQRLDNLIIFCLFAKIIGVPGLFNYYHLRLIPYYVRRFNSWKRRALREKDFFDHIRN